MIKPVPMQILRSLEGSLQALAGAVESSRQSQAG